MAVHNTIGIEVTSTIPLRKRIASCLFDNYFQPKNYFGLWRTDVRSATVAILRYRFLSCWCLGTFFSQYQSCSLLLAFDRSNRSREIGAGVKRTFFKLKRTILWWPRTAIKNIEICRNYFCYFICYFIFFFFKIKASESKM